MINSRHCALCDHQRTSFKDGIICGLTERKPEFNRICSRSLFDTYLKQELTKVHAHHEILRRLQTQHYVKFFGALGLTAILIGVGVWLLFTYGTEIRSVLYFAISIMGSAIAPLFWAFNTFVNFKQDLSLTQRKITQIDEVLALYRIRYDIQHTNEEIFYEEYEMFTEVALHR